MRNIVLPWLSLLTLLVPVAAAHHGDTEAAAEAAPPTPFTLYHSYIWFEQELKDLQAAYPDLFKYYPIGESVLGLTIYGVEITNFKSQDPPLEERKRLYFDGSIHSNEQLGMEMVFDIMHFLLDGYASNATAKWIVDHRYTYAVPLVNPDGNVRDSRRNVRDVDLNRNFPHGWGGPGSAAKGPGPASEPEVQAVIAFLQKVRPHYGNSFHTGVLMLLHPYGNYEEDDNVTSPDHGVFTKICEVLKDPMRAAHPNRRATECGQVYSTIYPASGSTVDYMYSEFGTNAWTFEVDVEQNLLLSLEAPRTRLGEAWAAIEHAFLNIEKYGALLRITDLKAVVDGGKVTGVNVSLANDGYGPSNNTRLVLHVGEEEFSVDVPSVAPGGQEGALVRGASLAAGAQARLEIVYNVTLFKGFPASIMKALEVVEDGNGLTLREADGKVLERIGGGGNGVPGFDIVLLGAAMIGFLWSQRRR